MLTKKKLRDFILSRQEQEGLYGASKLALEKFGTKKDAHTLIHILGTQAIYDWIQHLAVVRPRAEAISGYDPLKYNPKRSLSVTLVNENLYRLPFIVLEKGYMPLGDMLKADIQRSREYYEQQIGHLKDRVKVLDRFIRVMDDTRTVREQIAPAQVAKILKGTMRRESTTSKQIDAEIGKELRA